MAALYFDDLAVGQQFRSSVETMDRDRLVAFAAEFDPQPQHLGEEEARGAISERWWPVGGIRQP